MKKTFIAIIVILLFICGLYGEIYIKTDSHTDEFEMMGQKQPARDDVSEQWIGENRMVHLHMGQKTIIDLKKQMVYLVYQKEKAYVEIPMPLDMSKLISTEMAAMMSMWKIHATVTPTQETGKFGDWNCKAYDVDISMGMMNMKMKSWATTDVSFDWQNFYEKFYPTLLQATMGQNLDDRTLQEYKKIHGFQVANDIAVNFMGQQVTVKSRVTEISEKSTPLGIYAVPADYKKQDQLILQKWGMK